MRSRDEDQLLQRVIEEMGHGDRDFFDNLSQTEKDFVISAAKQIRDTGSCSYVDLLWEIDFRERPVSVETFISDPYYIGVVGESIYPKWREVLIQIFDEGRHVSEILFTGSIGIGKTSIAVLCMIYSIYKLSCLRSPQAFYGMIPKSPIVFGLYNVFKYKVEDTSFAMMAGVISSSPYFRERYERDPRLTTKIRFPNEVSIVAGATELHALGENLYSCLIDETDFMRGGSNSKTDPNDVGQAYKLYTSTARRMESRFLQYGGKVPGVQIMVSSKSSTTGFIEQRIKEHSKDSHVYIADFPLWEVKPAKYTGKTFPVYIGDEYSDPRILEDGDTAAGKVINVPVEHRRQFEEDIVSAIRDIAGVATVSGSSFIPSREAIMACIDHTRQHPFTKEQLSITIDSDEAIEDFLIHDKLFRISKSQYVPIINARAPRYIHIDLAITKDSVGFAMGHCSDVTTVTRIGDDGSQYQARAQNVYIDLMLRINPRKGTRIDFQKIRNFVFALRAYGYPIELVTLDSFQSEDSIQNFLKEGVESYLFSMDKPSPKNGHPHNHLRQLILENRISYYRYEHFLLEAANLQRDIDKNIVDHPPFMLDAQGRRIPGSKDVADSVGAVVRHCIEVSSGLTEIHDKPKKAAASRRADVGVKDPRWILKDYSEAQNIIGFDT